MKKVPLLKVFLVLVSLPICGDVFGQAVTGASGGTNISVDSILTGGYVPLTGPTIRETAGGQLTENGTIVLTLPAGYEWNSALTSADIILTVTPTGAAKTKLTASFTSLTATQVTFTINTASVTSGNGLGPARLDISGLELRPTSAIVPGSAMISNTGTTGPATNYGDLSIKAGAITEVRVETKADGTGTIVPTQNILAGTSLTVYAIARDWAGNFVENLVLAGESDWSLTDVTGNVLQSALVPSGNLQNSTFTSFKTGTAKIQASYAGITVTPSDTVTVLPRSTQKMVLQTQPATSAVAGETFVTQPVIYLYDQFNNLATTDNSTQVSVSLNSGEGILSGTLTQTAVNGIVTFTDLSADIANSITLKAQSAGLTDLISNAITVQANDPVDLAFIQQPTNTTQNTTISPAVKVQLFDTFGNEVDSSGVNVSVSQETFFKNSSTFDAVTDASGIATFSNLNIFNNSATGVSFTASFDNILSPVSSTPFDIISSGALAKFIVESIIQTDISTQTAGTSFNIRIRALDGSDATFTSYTDTVRIHSDAQIMQGGTPVSGITTGNFVGGILDTNVTLTTAGQIQIFVENTSLNRQGESNVFTILPAVYNVLTTIISSNPGEIVADGSSTSLITVQLKDEFGNDLTSGGETVELTTTAGTFTGGITTINATDAGNGSYSATLKSTTVAGLTAEIGGSVNTSSLSDSAFVAFSSGEVASFSITIPQAGGDAAVQTAGIPFNVTIEALDAAGNRVLNFNDQVNITSTSVLTGGATATLTNGIIVAHPLTLTQSGTNETISLSSDNFFGISGNSEAFEIIAGAPSAATSGVTASPSVLLSDPLYSSNIQIILNDQFGNKVFNEHSVSLALEQLELNNAPSSGTPNAGISAITFNAAQGIYTATLTATSIEELIEITAFYNTAPAIEINDVAVVDVVLPKLWSPGGGPGTTITDWTNEDNWQPIGVPDVNDFVVIQAGFDPPVLDLDIEIGSMEIESGVSLMLNGGSSITVSGNLQVDGSLNIEDNTDIIVQGNFVGTGSFSAGVETTIQVAGDISINGFLARTNNTIIQLTGAVPQTISVQTFLAENLHIQNEVQVDSSVNLLDIHTLTVDSGNLFELNTGGGTTIALESNLNGAGSFILNDNTLVLRGNASLNSVDASEGTVIFGIRTDESFVDFPDIIRQDIGSLSEIKHAVINNTAGIRVLENITVNDSLTLQNGPLIIESGNTIIASNIKYVNGFIRAKRSINASPGWRMLSSPIHTTYADLLDSTVTQGYLNSSLGITHNGDSLQPNVMWYQENYPGTDNQRWRAPVNATDTLTAGRGYFVYFFGNVTGDVRYDVPLPLTLDANGRENSAPTSFSLPVTYTATADTGWNLVGNPFTASLDWDSDDWIKTNMDNVLYIWDPGTNDYLYWNGIGGGDIEGAKLDNGIIPPFQAFWVKANAENPILSINISGKISGGTFHGKQKESAGIGFLLKAGGLSRSMHITLSPEGKNDKDIWDAYRLLPFQTNTYLELFTILKDGTQLAINNLPRQFGKEITLPIYIGGFMDGAPMNQAYTLSWPLFNGVPDAWTMMLEDLKTGDIINLRDQVEYTFDHINRANKPVSNTLASFKLVSPASNNRNKSVSSPRFRLYINPGEDANGLPAKFNLSNNYPNPFNSSTSFKVAIPIEGPVKLYIYDILGRKIAEIFNGSLRAGYHELTWNARSIASGVYFARLQAQGENFTKKLSLIK